MGSNNEKVISWRDWNGPVLDDSRDELAHASVADYAGYMRDHKMELPEFVTPAARVMLQFDAQDIVDDISEDWGPDACNGIDVSGLQTLLDEWAAEQEIDWFEGVQGMVSLAGMWEELQGEGSE